MPVVLQAGYILKTRFVCAGSGQYAYNVRHWFVLSVTGAAATDLDVATTLAGVFAPLYKNLLANTASYHGIGVQIVSPPPLPVEQISTVGQGVGTAGAEGLPPQSAGLGVFRTNLAGRVGRGFLYAPFPAELDSELAGRPTLAYQTKLQALLTQMSTNQSIGVVPNQAVLQPILFGKNGSVTPIITSSARTLWSQQRRRSLLSRADRPPF